MPPAIPSVKISQVAPSADEVTAARKLLAELPDGKKRSKMTCLKDFLIKKPDAAADMNDSRLRESYLEAFMVHQMRQKI